MGQPPPKKKPPSPLSFFNKLPKRFLECRVGNGVRDASGGEKGTTSGRFHTSARTAGAPHHARQIKKWQEETIKPNTYGLISLEYKLTLKWGKEERKDESNDFHLSVAHQCLCISLSHVLPRNKMATSCFVTLDTILILGKLVRSGSQFRLQPTGHCRETHLIVSRSLICRSNASGPLVQMQRVLIWSPRPLRGVMCQGFNSDSLVVLGPEAQTLLSVTQCFNPSNALL